MMAPNFFAPDVLAFFAVADTSVVAVFTGDFFAGVFFAADFFTEDFLEDFLAVGRFAVVDFLRLDALLLDFFVAILRCPRLGCISKHRLSALNDYTPRRRSPYERRQYSE